MKDKRLGEVRERFAAMPMTSRLRHETNDLLAYVELQDKALEEMKGLYPYSAAEYEGIGAKNAAAWLKERETREGAE